MAANTVLNLIDLDFDAFKKSFKSYAREQALFKDYDFDASNMSVLSDLLAYNTFQSSFYLNMLFSEMFLDSAQLRNSIASHAKDLNYVPRSFRSAKVVVDIAVQTDGTVSTVTIPKNQPFSTRVDSRSFQFVTDRNIVITDKVDNLFTARGVELFEGNYVVDTFYINYSIERQRFILSDPTIDTTSLTVVVSDDDGAATYTYASSLLGVNEDSKIFFLQAAEGDKYEIVFGNGVVGKRPKNGSTVYVEYRVCSGELPNGASEFTSDRNIGLFGDVTVTVTTDSSNTPIRASGGAVHESLDEIRFNAPRHYQTQERAITVNDYEILLKQQYPEINAITAYGGEEEDPPQYGKVFIAVDLYGFDGIPDYKKNQFTIWLKNKMPITTEPVFIDPTFTFAKMNVDVVYNQNVTDLTSADISARVLNTIVNYSAANLNKFKSTFRFSKLLTTIDETHPSIVSSYSTFNPYKKIVPRLNVSNDYQLKFFMKLKNDLPKLESIHPINQEKVVSSTVFTFEGKPCQLEDDNAGTLRIVYSNKNDTQSVVQNIGTIDYETGELRIANLYVSAFLGDAIKIYVTPRSNDVSFGRSDYFEIKEEDIMVTVSGVRE